MTVVWQVSVVLFVSYLLGSFPTGLIISKLARNVDVRDYGSGKTGATNVTRTAGAWAGALVLSVDIIKGALAVFLAGLITDIPGVQVAAAIAAVVGHDWPAMYKFRGGRGVCTALGGLLALAPLVGIITATLTLVIIGTSRYVSLGNVLGVISLPVTMLIFLSLGREPIENFLYSLAACALLLFQHRDNISRLLKGTERKLGQSAEMPNNGSSGQHR